MVYKEVVPLLQDWEGRHCLVRIQRHPQVHDGIITEVSEDPATLELRIASPAEGYKTLVFDFSGSDFQQWLPEPDEKWDEGFMVFLQGGAWLTLRKWKTSETRPIGTR
jgi:hypothetical protein